MEVNSISWSIVPLVSWTMKFVREQGLFIETTMGANVLLQKILFSLSTKDAIIQEHNMTYTVFQRGILERRSASRKEIGVTLIPLPDTYHPSMG